MKYIQRDYIKYNLGNGYMCSLVEALHATPPAADIFTKQIVEEIMESTGCAGIISTVSRKLVDLNRIPNEDNAKAIMEHRNVLKETLEFLNILKPIQNQLNHPFLHLSFHGMKDEHYGPFAIEIGTVKGESCSPEISDWVEDTLTRKTKEVLPNISFIFNRKFIGNPSISFHRVGDKKDYQGYGSNFNTIQIEISKTIRKEYRFQIIKIFTETIKEFQEKFVNPSRSN
ncbi:hypothetical protein [Oceanobacillus chungangensis]|uniref:N-formylglutamate amidohydrolase n=1 Tax=Oceanobacillus chungangensis TaxID=1229152 RepID=A0A3D8PX53_9BACI|nr:hypothetical protein [Oceanobacillus chungangensis]RDW20730.1 hypothetical protein CWR45_05755 [Oceanobacillus chungangensis]